MSKYYTFKERNSKELHKHISKYWFFAFSNEQFKEGMEKLGLKVDKDENKIYSMVGGGFMLKTEKPNYIKIMNKMNKVQRKYLSNYKNLVDALNYEMSNHECSYTGDYLVGLYALGFKLKDLKKNKKLRKAFYEAKDKNYKDFCKYN